jgi:hypothetical protein
VLEEYRHPDIISIAGIPLQLDFFYPQLNIAFEYQVTLWITSLLSCQGQQHYRDVGMFNASLSEGKQRDLTKTEICKQQGISYILALSNKLGITLIEVPYWWDRTYESLAATVYNNRPDLLPEKPMGKPIPTSPVAQHVQKSIPFSYTSLTILY